MPPCVNASLVHAAPLATEKAVADERVCEGVLTHARRPAVPSPSPSPARACVCEGFLVKLTRPRPGYLWFSCAACVCEGFLVKLTRTSPGTSGFPARPFLFLGNSFESQEFRQAKSTARENPLLVSSGSLTCNPQWRHNKRWDSCGGNPKL